MAIYIHDEAQRLRLRITGKLDDHLARELALCWATASSVIAGRKVVADLREVTGWSSSARAAGVVFEQLHEHGAEFLVRTDEQRAFVEQITGVPAMQASKPVGRRLRELLSR
jgi:hypothetical protein